jgi:hypothetical protein
MKDVDLGNDVIYKSIPDYQDSPIGTKSVNPIKTVLTKNWKWLDGFINKPLYSETIKSTFDITDPQDFPNYFEFDFNRNLYKIKYKFWTYEDEDTDEIKSVQSNMYRVKEEFTSGGYSVYEGSKKIQYVCDGRNCCIDQRKMYDNLPWRNSPMENFSS